MSEPTREERRWALIDQSQDYTPRWKVVNDRGPAANEYAERVEVMPVAEHEAALGALLSERDQLREAIERVLADANRPAYARGGNRPNINLQPLRAVLGEPVSEESNDG